jgi:hypothetical protein
LSSFKIDYQLPPDPPPPNPPPPNPPNPPPPDEDPPPPNPDIPLPIKNIPPGPIVIPRPPPFPLFLKKNTNTKKKSPYSQETNTYNSNLGYPMLTCRLNQFLLLKSKKSILIGSLRKTMPFFYPVFLRVYIP